ncbi:hypothetical protein D6D22_10811 [Aureobasidium pullulans]|uniref:Piwi domain-containing protein n=1 Tax=Aureobasidium pullulans TaxID=5580 RepID=A0A4S8WLK8_AURPU|nr:hypothetical protein D6D22_10811 [Aureobasidium pullulans]
MFILHNKNSITYGKIKRYYEYKLGGFTNTVFGPITLKEAILDNSVVIVSADVSYAAPGLNSPSMAAITVSISANATRYATAIKTNSYRVEMITDKNIEKYIISLIENG